MAQAAKVTPIHPAPFVIETSVPLPPRIAKYGVLSKVLRELAEAPVGASVLLPPATAKATATVCARATAVGGSGWATVRIVEGGFRIWKIAEPKFR